MRVAGSSNGKARDHPRPGHLPRRLFGRRRGGRAGAGVPAVGVGSLEALAMTVRPRDTLKEVIAACIDARRGQVYLQVFREGRAWDQPQALSAEDAVVEV